MSRDYAVIADREVFHSQGEGNIQLWELIEQKKWKDVLDKLKSDPQFVSSPKMLSEKERKEEGKVHDLSTPLHKAAEECVDVKIIEKLIKRGALKSIKNSDGLTPYDLAKKDGRYKEDALKLLRPPAVVMDNLDALSLMESKLQEIVKDLSCGLIEDHGVVLPQAAVLFEIQDRVHYLIPGMYGGFNFEVDMDKFEIEVFSFCRIVGGSERKQIIKKDASVEEIKLPYY